MNIQLLLTISTVALALSGAGCFLQPLTPEEEANLRAEIDAIDSAEERNVRNDDAPFADPGQGLGEPEPPARLETSHPSPWVQSGSDGKPDPTPWRTMGFNKPDPTPWFPGKSDEVESNGSGASYDSQDDNKPDPTPWVY